MDILYQCKEALKIQKFRRIVSYAGFYCFTTLITYAYTSNTTRAGISRADQYYASYPAGTELLTDTAKMTGAQLSSPSWQSILTGKGNHPIHIMLNIWHIFSPMGNSTEVVKYRMHCW